MHVSARSTEAAAGGPDPGALVDEAMEASRALVDIAARSLIGVGDEVTLPQYRVLVLVDSGGPSRSVDISRILGVHASTGSRLVDRLVSKGLVDRRTDPQDRRSNTLSITPEGHWLVNRVNSRRREEMRDLMGHLDAGQAGTVLTGLRMFSAAATASGHGTPAAQPPAPDDTEETR
ncbi:MarR family winged helix-turn-helix transcriptional regulator [Acidipropionibacterium virtanenii]|uniref:Multiple antibiotic resistance protein MarR n=1 Tax=Acidipropionibacterium virtanenii TaxID=2057246 RepID=A0A344UQA6_9ACTN|nr:MarR family transcriptional regulator [Acidipropionibacterium virtanenii]AXE37454.1 Multiple antibiotic resistance protein MarR [Acidipropionibacterium virtanenii]